MKNRDLITSTCIVAVLIVLLSGCKKNDTDENTNKLPTCEITAPPDGQEITKGETVTISVDATDSDGTIEEVRFTVDGVGKAVVNSFPYNYEWFTNNESLGYHIIKATSIDNNGGSNTDEITIKLLEDPQVVDFTVLDARIIEAQDLHDGATEGTEIGEYEAGSKAELQAAIDLATDVRNTPGVTQAQVDAAVVNLQAAIDEFESKKITAIAPENLVANWLFNGDATDASGNGHDGTLEIGHVNWGAGSVISVEDRLGNADYAYKFEYGGNIVIPQDPSLNPPELTIVTWINLYETWAHSYFLSNDIWNCWKFQVQDANKPFFTRKILKDDGSGENAWIDKDANTGILVNGVWTHIAMTYQSGEMIFYINGAEVMLWDDFPTGTPVDPNPLVDICIGQALPTGVFSDVPGDPYEWKEWLGYLKGSLDDLKIYNIVLTGTQVNQIYTWEVDNVVE